MSKMLKILMAVSIIASLITATEAELGENSLKVNLIKYDPYPVNPDSDFSIWVQVENIGSNDATGVSIEFIPKYPFSIKSGENAIKYPGTIRKNDKIIYKYSIHADKNAFIGTNTLEIGYRFDGSMIKRDFDIEIGSDVVDSKGTVMLEKYTIYPESLMSGDTGTAIITLKNSASEYIVKIDGKEYSMNAQIQSAELMGNDVIEVTGEPYLNTGIVGPGDSVELPYTIRVKNNTPDGTYFLDFNLRGSARLYGMNLKIPVTVDSSGIEAILAETPKANPGTIILNVANKRSNTVYAATVIPAGNATFEPFEYFIGTMEPDEMFTAKFDLRDNKEQNALIKLRFKNGNNWHESEALSVRLNGSKVIETGNDSNTTLLPVIGILGGVIAIISGIFIIMKRKRAKSGTS